MQKYHFAVYCQSKTTKIDVVVTDQESEDGEYMDCMFDAVQSIHEGWTDS